MAKQLLGKEVTAAMNEKIKANVAKLVEKGITPVINTGIANKVAGRGQIGAGTVHPPIECFEKAIVAYAKKLGFEAE